MDGYRVLIAIRERELCDEVVGHLRAADAGYDLVVRPHRRRLPAEIERLRPAVAVIDLHFGREDPRRSVLAAIRQHLAGSVPGLLVLAHHLEAGFHVNALELGADACLLAESLSRRAVQANVAWLARRHANGGHGRPGTGGILLSRQACQIHIRGQSYELTPSQLEILWTLASRAPAVVTPRDLVAGCDHLPDGQVSVIAQRHISRLRKRLGPHGSLIRTVRGKGYQFTATAALVP